MNTTRRTFMLRTAVGLCAAPCAHLSIAAGPPPVDEKDPQAAALGYKADATKTDKAKFPRYVAGQNCGNCVLFQGNAGAADGACALFAGKSVVAPGWCSAYAKKG